MLRVQDKCTFAKSQSYIISERKVAKEQIWHTFECFIAYLYYFDRRLGIARSM